MTTLLPRVTLALCVLAAPAIAHSQPKVWELNETVRSQVGNVHLSMEKNFARDAPIGDFWANAVNQQTGINAIFRGVCAEVIEVNVTATDGRKVDLSNFLVSRSGSDLPIGDVMAVLQDALSGQCEQLQVMRINFDVGFSREDYSYQGTAVRSEGWRLQDGLVATEHDSEFVFEINQRDMFSVAGVYYKGGCEEKPRLLLEPRYANNTERTLAELPDMPAFHMTAQSAAVAYREQCPTTQQIEFALNPIPEDYVCAAEGDCFLTARFDNDWVIDGSQFELKRYNNPIQDADDVVEVLAAGRFDILPNYDSYLRYYTEAWFGAYSDHCRAFIADPVLRQTQIVERKYDEHGSLIDEDFGPVRDIWIERELASVFDQVFQSWKPWAVGRMIRQVAEGNQGGRDPFDTVSRSFGFFTGTITQVENTVRDHCDDPRILTARDNMVRYFRSEPAITGRYTTDKEPQNSFPASGPSAPVFTQAVQAARRAEQAEVQAFRQQEQAAAHAERQARIQADIAARTPGNQGVSPSNQAIASGQSAATPAAQGTPVDPQQAYQDLQANLAKLQEMAQAHAARLGAVSKDYQARITATSDPAERLALQQEFEQVQAQMRQEYQQQVQALASP